MDVYPEMKKNKVKYRNLIKQQMSIMDEQSGELSSYGRLYIYLSRLHLSKNALTKYLSDSLVEDHRAGDKLRQA